MGLLSSFLELLGFVIGLCSGLLLGFILFIYRDSNDIKDPIMKPLNELDTSSLEEIMNEIPLWMKTPDNDRVDWLNKFILEMWPYLNKGICGTIRRMAEPIFKQYIGKFHIEAIEFESLSLGTLPPKLYGMKVCKTNEKELVMEPALRWAGNPNISFTIKLLSLRLKIQLVDLQIFAAPRITLKPLVPTFPCFANVVISLMEKPHVDFGLKILGGDIMSIPGLYHFIQDTIKKQVATLYLWPQTLVIPILDASSVAVQRPVGILHVTVVRAMKLLKMDILGTSDPYVKLSFSGERLSEKKTTVKMKNLNPVWNEKFRFIVKDPQLQALELQVYDWDKVGGHDRLGMQLIPLSLVRPNETKRFTLDLVKNTNVNDPQNKKQRGQLVVELTYVPFRTNSITISDNGDESNENMRNRKKSRLNEGSYGRAGLLLVTIQGAEDVEGEHHNNPYALIHFKGEKRKTKMMKKTHNPTWGEEFQFMLEEPPLDDKIHIEVLSKRTGLQFRSKLRLPDATAITKSLDLLTQFLATTLTVENCFDGSRSSRSSCNQLVISWILHSVSPEIKSSIMYLDTATEMWTVLNSRFNQGNGPRIFELNETLTYLYQGDDTVSAYFTKLISMWDKINQLRPRINYTCAFTAQTQDHINHDQVLQFFKGLNETYHATRYQILLIYPFPPLNKVFSMVIHQERQRTLGNRLTPPITAATNTNPPLAPDPNPAVNKNSKNKRPRPHCTHCQKLGHYKDKCYFLHGFPPGYGKPRSSDTSNTSKKPEIGSTNKIVPQTHNISLPSGDSSTS
uniref:Uncharacterized protein n=1 Tax=Cannabis sativa TaxID=3483 RepID=A0A803P2J1_CANSA